MRAADAFLGESFQIVGSKDYGALLFNDAIAMKIDPSNTMAFPIARCHQYCYRLILELEGVS